MRHAKDAMRILAWAGSAIGLHAAVLALDVYWNLFDWRPKWDLLTGVLLAWIGAMPIAFWILIRTDRSRISRTASWVVCAGFIVLAVYAFPAEDLTDGVLGRTSWSPFWYRGTRSIILALPAAFRLLFWKRVTRD